MLVYMLLVSTFVIYRDKLANADIWRGHINNFYIILFFVMLLYLNAISKEKLEKEIIKQKDTQLYLVTAITLNPFMRKLEVSVMTTLIF